MYELKILWEEVKITYDMKGKLVLFIKTNQSELLKNIIWETPGYTWLIYGKKWEMMDAYIYPQEIDWLIISKHKNTVYYFYLKTLSNWSNDHEEVLESIHQTIVDHFEKKYPWRIYNMWDTVDKNQVVYIWAQKQF